MPKALANRETVFETVRVLWIQGFKTAAISEKTGVNQKTVRTWSSRYSWHAIVSDLKEDTRRAVGAAITDEIARQSEEVKGLLAEELRDQAKTLRRKSIRNVSELRNKDGVQGRAAVVKMVTDAAAKVFAWDGEQECPLIGRDDLRSIETPSESSTEAPAAPLPLLPIAG